MNRMTVRVEHTVHGCWEIALPDERERLTCASLDEASRVAYGCAADRRPCELIVCDAYHRVLRRELINSGSGARTRAAPTARPLP